MTLLLKTERLVLRDFQPGDFAAVHAYAAIPEFSRFEAWGPNTPEDTRKYIADMMTQASQNPRWKFELAITLANSGQLIGGSGIRRESQESAVANLGWAVNSDFQRQGFATEAAQALINFGFKQMGLSLIYATCDARNQASSRVMEKLGMKRVGLLIGDREQKGEKRDTLRYEILG